MKVRALLEKHFKDMQDLEFTVEDNRLYILQTRNGKRTGLAAVRIAVEMVEERLITKEDAIKRIPADSLGHLLAPIFDRKSIAAAKKIGSGLAAGPGAASGHVVLSAEEAVRRAASRRESGSRPHRNFPRRPARHDRGRGHSHFARRRFLARGAGRAADGQGLRLRRIRNRDRLSKTHPLRERRDLEGRRLHFDRRDSRRSFRRRSDDRAFRDRAGAGRSLARWEEERDLSAIRQAHELGRSRAQAGCAHQRRHARAGRERGRVRRQGDRPLPHRAHVFRGRPDRRDARDDSGRGQGGARQGAGQVASVSARGFRRHLQGARRIARQRFVFSIRRCTNFSRTRRSSSSISRRKSAFRSRTSRAGCASCTSSTHARSSRLPARDCFSGDFRDAGARHFRSRRRSAERRAKKFGPKS